MLPTTIRHRICGAVIMGMMTLLPAPAQADATAFVGGIRSGTSQQVRGAAVGASLLVVGIEFEFADASEDVLNAKPSLTTGTICGLAQTPIGRVQFYGTLGVGMYRERVADASNTGTSMAAGGGAKIALAGPLRLRLDYRVITLKNSVRTDKGPVQRFYAGVNLKF